MTVPFAFAKAYGLFSSTVSQLIRQREEKIQQDKEDYFKKSWDAIRKREAEEAEYRERKEKEKMEKVLADLTHRLYPALEPDSLKFYVLLCIDSDVKRTLEPYFTARFAPELRSINISEKIGRFLWKLDNIRRFMTLAREYKDEYDKKWFTLRRTITGNFKLIDRRYWKMHRVWTFKSDELIEGKHYQFRDPFLLDYKPLNPLFSRCNIEYYFHDEEEGHPTLERAARYDGCYYELFFEDFFLDDFQKWLTEYEEGALVVLFLLETVFWPGRWNFCKSFSFYKEYNSLHIPAIANREPLEVLLLLDKLCSIIASISSFGSKRARYYWFPDGFNPPEESVESDKLISQFSDPERFSKILYEGCGLEAFDKQLQDKRFFEKLREEGNNQWWFALAELARIYLKRRAHDIARYSKKVADIAFPQPTVYGATARQVAELVERMAVVSQPDQQKDEEKEEKEKLENQQRIQQEYESRKPGQLIPLPENVPSRVLAASDIEAVKKACLSEICSSSSSWNGKNALTAIEDFVEFCTLLSKPENLIKVRTSQYVEKRIYIRSTSDMKAEMAQELAGLPAFTAWVKRIDDSNMTVKNKTRIYNVAERFEYNKGYREILQRITEKTHELYCTRRDLIEEEINKRQAKWRGSAPSPPVGKVPSQEAAGDSDKPGKPKPPLNRLPSEKTTDEKARDRSGKSKPPPNNKPAGKVSDERVRSKSGKPPPSSIPNPAAQEAKEPAQPRTKSNPGEKGLIYRSNFYLPDDRWTEKETTDARKFRREGFYHIELNRSYTTIELIEIPVTDFRVHVDAELLKGETVIYGVCFRCIKARNGLSFYLSAFTPTSWGLLLYHNRDYISLADYRSCEFIRHNSINSLMVQMVGQRITLEVNGHIVGTVTDNCLTSGCVGLFMRKEGYSPAEVRFRDFRLYSLE